MTQAQDEAIAAFEAKAISAIMAEGFDRAEAQDIFDDWLDRKYKRMMADRFQKKLMAIR